MRTMKKARPRGGWDGSAAGSGVPDVMVVVGLWRGLDCALRSGSVLCGSCMAEASCHGLTAMLASAGFFGIC